MTSGRSSGGLLTRLVRRHALSPRSGTGSGQLGHVAICDELGRRVFRIAIYLHHRRLGDPLQSRANKKGIGRLPSPDNDQPWRSSTNRL